MLPALPVGSFIAAGKSLEKTIERVKHAEELGYDSVNVTHLGARDSLAVIEAYACATERVHLGTSVTPIYSRTPVAMAQAAATIDELSNSRFRLGLGVSHQLPAENWYGQTISKPRTSLREYVGILRAILPVRDPPPNDV